MLTLFWNWRKQFINWSALNVDKKSDNDLKDTIQLVLNRYVFVAAQIIFASIWASISAKVQVLPPPRKTEEMEGLQHYSVVYTAFFKQ